MWDDALAALVQLRPLLEALGFIVFAGGSTALILNATSPRDRQSKYAVAPVSFQGWVRLCFRGFVLMIIASAVAIAVTMKGDFAVGMAAGFLGAVLSSVALCGAVRENRLLLLVGWGLILLSPALVPNVIAN